MSCHARKGDILIYENKCGYLWYVHLTWFTPYEIDDWLATSPLNCVKVLVHVSIYSTLFKRNPIFACKVSTSHYYDRVAIVHNPIFVVPLRSHTRQFFLATATLSWPSLNLSLNCNICITLAFAHLHLSSIQCFNLTYLLSSLQNQLSFPKIYCQKFNKVTKITV